MKIGNFDPFLGLIMLAAITIMSASEPMEERERDKDLWMSSSHPAKQFFTVNFTWHVDIHPNRPSAPIDLFPHVQIDLPYFTDVHQSQKWICKHLRQVGLMCRNQPFSEQHVFGDPAMFPSLLQKYGLYALKNKTLNFGGHDGPWVMSTLQRFETTLERFLYNLTASPHSLEVHYIRKMSFPYFEFRFVSTIVRDDAGDEETKYACRLELRMEQLVECHEFHRQLVFYRHALSAYYESQQKGRGLMHPYNVPSDQGTDHKLPNYLATREHLQWAMKELNVIEDVLFLYQRLHAHSVTHAMLHFFNNIDLEIKRILRIVQNRKRYLRNGFFAG